MRSTEKTTCIENINRFSIDSADAERWKLKQQLTWKV